MGPRIALVLGPGSDCFDAGNTNSLFIFEGIRMEGSRPGPLIIHCSGVERVQFPEGGE